MIWTLDRVDAALLSAFADAGDIDQAVVDQRMEQFPSQQHAPARSVVKRWYYLLADNPRIGLVCISQPLYEWLGSAFLIVGTRTIIGEFEANKAFVGKLGLHLKMQPLAWLTGEADRHFATGAQLLAEISEQVLDRRAIRESQERRTRMYEWKKRSG